MANEILAALRKVWETYSDPTPRKSHVCHPDDAPLLECFGLGRVIASPHIERGKILVVADPPAFGVRVTPPPAYTPPPEINCRCFAPPDLVMVPRFKPEWIVGRWYNSRGKRIKKLTAKRRLARGGLNVKMCQRKRPVGHANAVLLSNVL